MCVRACTCACMYVCVCAGISDSGIMFSDWTSCAYVQRSVVHGHDLCLVVGMCVYIYYLLYIIIIIIL